MHKLSVCTLLAAVLLAASGGTVLADAPGTAPSTDRADAAPAKKKHHHHHHKAKSHKKAAAAKPTPPPHG